MKQTEIGLIPDDWEVKEISSIKDKLVVGFVGTCEKYYTTPANGIAMLRTGDLKESYIDFSNTKYVTKEFHTNNRKSQLHKNDILIARHGSNGHGVLFESNINANSLNIVIFHPDEKQANPKYTVYQLDSTLVKNQVNSFSAGSTQEVINTSQIAKLKIPLPSTLTEQQRIAKALSDVDALISTTEKLIKKKKNIKQGAMQNLLTGKKRLPGFGSQTNPPTYKQTELGPIPEDWEVKSLGDIFSIKHGYGFEGQFFSSENNQHIVVTPGNFKLEGGFQKQKQPIYYTGTYPDEFKLKPNDLIIMMTDLSKNSDTLGNPAIVPDDGNDYLHNQRIGLIQIHNDSFVKDYIYLLLCTKEYHEAVVSTAAGSTVKHTSPNRIYSINLVVSTSKEEQTAIANVLSSMDKEIEILNIKLEKYRNLKTAMMQQLLTGKIRLVN